MHTGGKGKVVWLALAVVALQLAQAPPAQAGTSYVKTFHDGSVLHNAAGMTTDDLGNVYVAEFSAHRIVKFNKDGKPLIKFGQGSYETQGTQGHLYYPTGVAFANGHLYVTDFADHVNVFSTDGDSITQWGGVDQLNGPLSLTADCVGHLYVANSRNGQVIEYDGNGNKIKIFGTGILAVPYGIAIDQSTDGSNCVVASIYVADEYYNNIVQFSGTGEKVTTIGGPGTGPLQFTGPAQLALDKEPGTPNFTLWVAEEGGRAQQLVSADGGAHWSYGGEIRNGGDQPIVDTHALTLTPNGHLLVANTGGLIFEYANRSPALTLNMITGRSSIRDQGQLKYDVRYNQLDKTCDVLVTAKVAAPHHSFTLEDRVADVGENFKVARLHMTNKQLGFLKKAWKDGDKVPVHATAKGSCSDNIHVTKHEDSKI